MFIALFYTCKYKKCRGESNAEIKFRPGLVIKRDERVKREERIWLIWCQGIDYFRFAAWLDCIVHTESDWGIWCVYMCVCKVQQHCSKLPCRRLVVESMKGASPFFSCLLPIIRVCTASKMAGGSGVCVCVYPRTLACSLYVIMCARTVGASMGAKAVCTHCSGTSFSLDAPLWLHFLFMNIHISTSEHKIAVFPFPISFSFHFFFVYEIPF